MADRPCVFIATPMYGGQCSSIYVESLLNSYLVLPQLGVDVHRGNLDTESLIPRARNTLEDFFVNETECTHLMWIDADEGWLPHFIVDMLTLKKPIVGAPYPKKEINWEHIKEAVLRNPEIDPAELRLCGSRFNFNIIKQGEQKMSVNLSQPWRVVEVGTGFMLIERQTLLDMRAHYPELKYSPRKGEVTHDRQLYALFDTEIAPETRTYNSEDYTFCERWTRMGGEIWLLPWIEITHVGPYHFPGSVAAVVKNVGKLR